MTLTQDASIPASSRLRAVGVTASPHFYDGFDAVLARRRRKNDNGSFRTVLFSILFASISTRRTSSLHRALRFLAGYWSFAGDSEASDWQPMALRDGTPEWADSFFQGRVRGLRVPLPAALYEFVYWLDFLSYMTTDASNFQSPLTPLRVDGEMAMVALLLPSLVWHSLCSRADLTSLDRYLSLFLCFGCHFTSPHGWEIERNSPTRMGEGGPRETP